MKFYVALLISLLLSACGSTDIAYDSRCGMVSGFKEPNNEAQLYRTVVSHINGKPVISEPNYILPLGDYQFTVFELINAPELKVTLAARQPKVLAIKVEENQRYHLGAKLKTDKIYRGTETDYWEPVVWLQEKQNCQLPKEVNARWK